MSGNVTRENRIHAPVFWVKGWVVWNGDSWSKHLQVYSVSATILELYIIHPFLPSIEAVSSTLLQLKNQSNKPLTNEQTTKFGEF